MITMIAVVNHIKARNKESYEKIIQLFKNRARLVDKFPGFKGFKLFCSDDELEIMVMTIWKDRESFKSWVDSEEFKRGHARTRNTNIDAESRGVVYEIIVDE